MTTQVTLYDFIHVKITWPGKILVQRIQKTIMVNAIFYNEREDDINIHILLCICDGNK